MEDNQPNEEEPYLASELRAHGLLKAVRDKVRLIAITNIESVVHIGATGEEPSVRVEENVGRLINTFRILRRCGLESLSAKDLAGVLETALRVEAIFELMANDNPDPANNRGDRRDIAAQADEVAQSSFQSLGLIISRTFFTGDYFVSQVDDAGRKFDTIANLSREAQDLLAVLRSSAQDEFSGKVSAQFDEQANSFGAAALKWSLGTYFFATAGIAWLTVVLIEFQRRMASMLAIKGLELEVFPLFIAIILYFLMVQCFRNSRSYKHNQVTSIQRGNALKAGKILADIAGPMSAKENILLQAAKSALSLGSTAFEE
jgi:hypothetical protein